MGYCLPEDVRLQTDKKGKAGASSDENLDVIIDAASLAVDGYYNRPDGFFVADTAASKRLYSGSGRAYQYFDECTEITLVAVKDSATDSTYTSWAASDWIAFRGSYKRPNFNETPYHGLIIDPNGNYSVFTGGTFTTRRGFRPMSTIARGTPTVEITAKWGYATTVPAIIKQATIALSSRWFKQGEGAWGDTLSSVELGQLIYRKENSDILLMLKNGRFFKPNIG